MSPFAAGCAICGTDLEAARSELAARKRITVPTVKLPGARAEVDWVHVAIAFILAIGLAPIGLLLALYWAQQRRNTGQTTMMWLMLGAAALSLAALLAPVWFWSHIYGGL